MALLQEGLEQVRQELVEQINKATDATMLEQVRVTFLGRQGKFAHFMQTLATLGIEEKRRYGPLLNQLKQEAEQLLAAKKSALDTHAMQQELAKQRDFDVTAYLPHSLRGTLHPLTHIVQDLENIFISMGYEIVDGPEVETEFYNFDALNIPADHPARDMWDTFWLTLPGLLLRTHTSAVQIHALQERKPPIALVASGRCYRHEATDATHDFMFMQMEGLVIDKGISLAHLLGTHKSFLKAFFGNQDLALRVRPSYFPFVEPGVEIDIECPFCKQGCSLCKKTRWIEISGAGLVHPHVLQSAGIDPDIYTGFAFGTGITRLAMLKYGINDIRLLSGGSLGFLQQF